MRLMHACDRIGGTAQWNTHVITLWLDECSFLKTTCYYGYKHEFYANSGYMVISEFKCILRAFIAFHCELVVNAINCIYYILIELYLVFFFFCYSISTHLIIHLISRHPLFSLLIYYLYHYMVDSPSLTWMFRW